MRRLLIVLILIVAVVGCNNPSDHNVSFGMTMDEVKDAETRGRMLWEDSSSITYTDIEFEGLPALLLYYFSDGLLTLFHYSFDLEYANEDNYEHLKSRLIDTYGKPNGEPQFNQFTILSATWDLPDKTIILRLFTNPMTEDPSLFIHYEPV